jgi:hypothetical protein
MAEFLLNLELVSLYFQQVLPLYMEKLKFYSILDVISMSMDENSYVKPLKIAFSAA